MLQRYADAEVGRQGESPDHLRNADALHRQRCFIRHSANLLAMLAGLLARPQPLTVRIDREVTRCPWTNGSPVISRQSSGCRPSASNDQPPATPKLRQRVCEWAQQEELIRRSIGQSPASRTGNAVPQADHHRAGPQRSTCIRQSGDGLFRKTRSGLLPDEGPADFMSRCNT